MYLAGESYAGTYLPYFASRMLELNRNGDKKASMGNGREKSCLMQAWMTSSIYSIDYKESPLGMDGYHHTIRYEDIGDKQQQKLNTEAFIS